MRAGRTASAALVAVASLTMGGGPAAAGPAAGPAPAIEVVPSTDLVDGQGLAVRGRGFTPGAALAVLECDARATDQSGCDLGTTRFGRAGADGTFSVRFVADRTLNTEGLGVVDCARAPGACYLVAAETADIARRAVEPLSFDPDAPLPHPLRVRVDVRRVGLVRDGRAVLEGTLRCNGPADAVVSVTLVQEASPEDVRGFGETAVQCGDDVAWRITVPVFEGGGFRPRHAVADVQVFAFGEDDAFAEDGAVARVELRS